MLALLALVGTIGLLVVEALTPRHVVVPVNYGQCQIRVHLGTLHQSLRCAARPAQSMPLLSTAAVAGSARLGELLFSSLHILAAPTLCFPSMVSPEQLT